MSISRQFSLLSLHPTGGNIMVSATRFRYGLAAAFLMDFYLHGEISEENKRLITLLRKNGDPLHDRLCDAIGASSRPRKILYWVRKLAWKNRQNIYDTFSIFVSNGSIRYEKKYFLWLFPYNRYYLNDQLARSSVVENLREVVIKGKSPGVEQLMLLGLMKSTNSLDHLANEYRENQVIRARVKELFNKDEYMPEQQKFIRLSMSAVSIAIAAAEASHSV